MLIFNSWVYLHESQFNLSNPCLFYAGPECIPPSSVKSVFLWLAAPHKQKIWMAGGWASHPELCTWDDHTRCVCALWQHKELRERNLSESEPYQQSEDWPFSSHGLLVNMLIHVSVYDGNISIFVAAHTGIYCSQALTFSIAFK